jgi:hypothetical protein
MTEKVDRRKGELVHFYFTEPSSFDVFIDNFVEQSPHPKIQVLEHKEEDPDTHPEIEYEPPSSDVDLQDMIVWIGPFFLVSYVNPSDFWAKLTRKDKKTLIKDNPYVTETIHGDRV